VASLLVELGVINHLSPPLLSVFVPSLVPIIRRLLSFLFNPLEHLHPPYKSDGLINGHSEHIVGHLSLGVSLALAVNQLEVVPTLDFIDVYSV